MKPLRNLLAATAFGFLAAISLSVSALAQVPSQFVNAQTGTTYTLTNADQSRLVTFNNAVSVAVTLPRAGNNDAFNTGWYVDIENIGAGIVTITPATSTINGSTTYAVNQNQSLRVVSDGTNYQIMAQTTGTSSSFSAVRNVLDNGAMAVVQRSLATTAATGAINGAACLAVDYFADRWCIDTNVASGAGFGQVVTATPSPLTGFSKSLKLYRNSGALTQPVCAVQEVSTANSILLQGQQAVLSYYAQALAGLSADNGNVINAYVVTGTGSDEGLGTWTASPAITPAWTGIASTGGTATTITTSWARYSQVVTIPTGAKEIAVEICFTPTATGAGATDGFALVGVQLERGTAATLFAYLPYDQELLTAQRYYVEYADAATTVSFPATCTETTSGTVAACTWILPTTMRTAPAAVVLTATSFGKTKVADGTAGACSTLAVIASSATTNSYGFTCALSETAAVGTMARLIGGNTAATNTITFSSVY